MGHAAEALAPLRRAVQLDEEMYDSGSAELLPAKIALAAAYLDTGNRDESAKLFSQIESVRKLHRHLGERFEAPLRALQRRLASPNSDNLVH